MQSAKLTTVGALPCAPTVCRSSARLSQQQKTVTALAGPTSRPMFHGKTPSLSLKPTPPSLLPSPPCAKPEQKPSVKSTEFGYSRKDVVVIGVGLIAFGYILYYGLQYGAGMDPGMAGNYVQLIIFIGICFGWVGSYLYRVANKQMTYVKQLEEYEEAVMKKRLEEMPEAEVERVMEEIQKEKDERMEARKNRGL